MKLVAKVMWGGGVGLRFSSVIQEDESGAPVFFGTPKVIFGVWHESGIPHIDRTGKYGMCQDAVAIADDVDTLDLIAKAMDGSRFRRVMDAVKFNTREWNRNVIPLLRKDFWKQFLDDNGNLIDESGRHIDRKGNLIDEDGNVISDDEGDRSETP